MHTCVTLRCFRKHAGDTNKRKQSLMNEMQGLSLTGAGTNTRS